MTFLPDSPLYIRAHLAPSQTITCWKNSKCLCPLAALLPLAPFIRSSCRPSPKAPSSPAFPLVRNPSPAGGSLTSPLQCLLHNPFLEFTLRTQFNLLSPHPASPLSTIMSPSIQEKGNRLTLGNSVILHPQLMIKATDKPGRSC